jgi:hypothetical protein
MPLNTPGLTLGHVVRLKDLSLIASSISVHGERRVVLVLSKVLLGEGDSGSERNLGADNTVATEETKKTGVG